MPDASGNVVSNPYGEISQLVERLHRRYLDVIRDALSKLGIDDINTVQALLLMNVQDAEVTIRELVNRGYYVGANVTYNVRHLIASGYLLQNRSGRDRRSVHIHATEKGRELCKSLRDMETSIANSINVEPEDIDSALNYLYSLELVWSDAIQFSRN